MTQVTKKVGKKSKSLKIKGNPDLKPNKKDKKATKNKFKNEENVKTVVPIADSENKVKSKTTKKIQKQKTTLGEAKLPSAVIPELKPNPFAKLPVIQTDYIPGALSAVLGLGSIKKTSKTKKQARKAKSEESDSEESETEAVPAAESAEVAMDVDQPWLKTASTIQPKEQSKEKKKKQKAADADVEGVEAEKGDTELNRDKQRQNRRKSEDKMTEEEKARTIFVGNVNKETSEKDVKNLFKPFGAIDSIRMRGIVPANNTITKKVAKISQQTHARQVCVNYYIKFKEADSVEKALELNGTTHWDHRIRVDTVVAKKEYDNKHTIFLGNVPFDADEDSLAAHFETHVGNVNFARLVRDSATGLGKGFAFVVFKDTASVTLALNLTGVKYKKRELRISKILKKNKLKKTFNQENVDKHAKGGNAGKGIRKLKSFGKNTVRNAATDAQQKNKKYVKKAIGKRKAKKDGKSIMTK